MWNVWRFAVYKLRYDERVSTPRRANKTFFFFFFNFGETKPLTSARYYNTRITARRDKRWISAETCVVLLIYGRGPRLVVRTNRATRPTAPVLNPGAWNQSTYEICRCVGQTDVSGKNRDTCFVRRDRRRRSIFDFPGEKLVGPLESYLTRIGEIRTFYTRFNTYIYADFSLWRDVRKIKNLTLTRDNSRFVRWIINSVTYGRVGTTTRVPTRSKWY